MEVSIRFPEDVGRKVLQLPERDAFVTEAVARALKDRSRQQPAAQGAGGSKWARLVEKVKRNPQRLGDYHQQFKKDMREFRESFHFKHDELP